MSITTAQPHPLIGASVAGLDLSKPLSAQTAAALKALLDERQVLVFRGQQLDQEAFLEFSRTFGEPEVYALRGYGGVPDGKTAIAAPLPLVQRLTNLGPDGQPMGPCPQMDRMSIAENWHSDSSYRAVPSYVTMLYGVEIPSVGGDTHFTSLHAAYDALTDGEKTAFEDYKVVHNWEFQRKRAPGVEPITDEERKSVPAVVHKLVQTHPQTGRKLLFLSSGAEYILGLPYAEGRALIVRLIEASTRPEAVYTHKWQPGDVVLWDNRATLHRAGDFDYRSPTLRRLLHRIVIAGDDGAYAQEFAPEQRPEAA